MVAITKANNQFQRSEMKFRVFSKIFIVVQSFLFGVSFFLVISKQNHVLPIDDTDTIVNYGESALSEMHRQLAFSDSSTNTANPKSTAVWLLDYNDVVPIDLDKIYKPMSKRNTLPVDYFTRRRSIFSRGDTGTFNFTVPIDKEEECQAIYGWEDNTYPTCNTMHEIGWVSSEDRNTGSIQSKLINNGLWRDVWKLTELRDHNVALKTLRYKQDFKKKVYNSQRIDALLMERLTSSRHIASIYGFCGVSGIFDFSNGGDLEQYFKYNKEEKFQIALEISQGLSDFHHHINDNVENEDKQSLPFEVGIVHSDIAVRQFLKIDGVYKLNDFNIAKFIRWNPTTKKKCLPTIGLPTYGDRNRAPEEYVSHKNEIDEKIDVYSLGNVFYKFLMNERKYDSSNLSHEEVRELIKSGERPPIPDKLQNSTNPIDIALLHAMDMCLKLDPSQRASSKEIFEYLTDQKKNIALSE